MKLSGSEKLYCSLDIETSGFDPLTNEILEVGFAFFTVGEKGLKIMEEWTQVFNPSKPVSAQILGLTGISKKELDNAPKFSEHQKFLQEKLGNAIIVGHNITFDIKFLEAFGIKFSGGSVDTLDLVQFILPTHHSYNLENLMHTFAVAHKEAHRALADSKAALKLLEKLLSIYGGFDEKLKKEIQKVLKGQDFLWKSLLDVKLEPSKFSDFTAVKPLSEISPQQEIKLKPNTFLNFPLGEKYIDALAEQKSKYKILLVVPKAQRALELQRSGKVKAAAFLPELSFDGKKFSAFLKKKDLTPDEARFALKVLVWLNMGSQTQTILDLNLSFFGGQFKAFINGGEAAENKTASVVACDLGTFLYLSRRGLYKNRHVVICGLSEFETGVTSNIGTKASWGYIAYLLKSFYNFELNIGLEKFKQAAGEAQAATDLFFGIASALVQGETQAFTYYKITPQVEYEEKYQKIKSAAENYSAKLLALNETFSSEAIGDFAKNLEQFFSAEDNRVKWVESAPNHCTFFSMPLDITSLVESVLKPFAKVTFADALDTEVLPKFFITRLGLEKFGLTNIFPAKEDKSAKAKQGDLFSSVKKIFTNKETRPKYHVIPEAIKPVELMELVGKGKNLPAAVLFGSPTQVREFYEANYQNLKSASSLQVQNNSGGSNKILRNFSINNNGLLLCTDKFILKSLTNQNPVETVNRLAVKTLVIGRLPFEQFTHPYQEALGQSFPNAFEDYGLPRALFNFHSLIKFFYTPELMDIYIIDSKLAKPYAKVFKDYYKIIPNAALKD